MIELTDPSQANGYKEIFNCEIPFEIRKKKDSAGPTVRKVVLELIKVKVLQLGENEVPESVKLELSCEADLFFHYIHCVDEQGFASIQTKEKLMVPFRHYGYEVLVRMLNGCLADPRGHFGVLIMTTATEARLEFYQNLEYKLVQLLSLECTRSTDEVVQKHITFRYNSIKHELLLTRGELSEVTSLVKIKNPNLLQQLENRVINQYQQQHTYGTTHGVSNSLVTSTSVVTFIEEEEEVEEEVSWSATTTLPGWAPFDTVGPTWKPILSSEFSKTYFKTLLQFLISECRSYTVFPLSKSLFHAFNLCPFEAVKVVIIGSDPYNQDRQSDGLAYSVNKGVQIPPSLQAIFKEAMNDPKVRIHPPSHGSLECWAKQGVLLMNSVLTARKTGVVSKMKSNPHQKKGWESFTDAVVRALSEKEGLVYLLWGKSAQTKCNRIDRNRNIVIECSHPSPMAAAVKSSRQPFLGSKCFSRCNAALISMDKEPIDWNVR